LKETGRCAVGRWAVRGKAYIVLLRPVGDVLTMQQLHFATDVRPATEIEVPKPEVKAGELKLARQLIEQQATERFDPSSFTDDVRERIRAAIDRKVEGQAITVSEEPAESGGKVIDLMEALRASLEKTAAARAPASRLGPRKEPKRVEQGKRVEPAAKPARKSARR
jgi:DNA end-binding protein Ku